MPLKHITEGKIGGKVDVTGRLGIRRKKLLDDLKEKSGSCKQKEEALDRTQRRTRFGRVYGLVVKVTIE